MEGSDDEFSPFLEREWSDKKNGKVKYYRRLSAFCNEKFPQIRLATELEKEILIKDLAKSPTFKATKRTLRSLASVDDLSGDQASEVLEAALNNNQIYWIAEEPSVHKTLAEILAPHREALDPELLDDFDRLYAKEGPPAMPKAAVGYGPDPPEDDLFDPPERTETPQSSVAHDEEIPFRPSRPIFPIKILLLHGWHSVPGGVKPSYLDRHGHEVINPALSDDDWDEAVRTAQAEYNRHRPDVIVGSSRGGAVAMNIDSGSTPLVLLCPAWKRWGTVKEAKPGTVILHSEGDDVIPIAESGELVRASGLPESALVVVGNDHRLADPEPLQAMLAACERAVLRGKTGDD